MRRIMAGFLAAWMMLGVLLPNKGYALPSNTEETASSPTETTVPPTEKPVSPTEETVFPSEEPAEESTEPETPPKSAALDALKLQDAEGNEIPLDPSFDPDCFRYEVQLPAAEEITVTLSGPEGIPIYANDALVEDNTCLWDPENRNTLTLRLKGEGTEETSYVLLLAQEEELEELLEEPVLLLAPETALTGSGTQESPYHLTTEADLRLLDTWVTEGDERSKGYFRMENDIAITGTWDGIGDEDTPFTGDFDGGGHQITIPEGGKALFSRTRGAVIHDLKLYGPKIQDYGLVSHYVEDKVEKYYAKFYRVTLVKGTKTLYSGFIGGYASGEDRLLIEDCTVESGVTVGYDRKQSHIGAFAGEFNGYVRNCTSAADVYGVDWVGGLVGNKGQSMGDFEITDCSFSGSVTASGNYAGGIVGGGYAGTGWGLVTAPNARGVVIQNCTGDGIVFGKNGVGGILGAEGCVQQFWDNGVGYIQNNRFTGFVSCTGKYAGGIIGFMQSLNANMVITGNYYENAEDGIGAVAHVDTSAVPNGFRGNTYYYNTSKYVSDGNGGVASYEEEINCVALKQYIELSTIGEATTGSNRAVSKPEMNRADDPLGADKNKLCFTEGSEPPKTYATGMTLEGTPKKNYTQGEALVLDGLTLIVKWSDGTETQVSAESATVSGYNPDTPGKQTVRLRYEGQEVRFTVTVTPKSTDITVSVSILGDTHHSDPTANGGPHGLAKGGLTTWASETLTANTTNTVWDVLQKVAKDANLRMDANSNNQYGTVYISGVNGLSEFDNGKNSGWMYTVNGTHPEVGVSARYLKDGDEIIFHYTDDYTLEEGSDKYNSGTTDTTGSAQKVISLISAIGTVTATDECWQKIDAARKAYNALSDGEKEKVSNYSVLQAAELKYQELQSAGTQEQVKNVEDLIAKIGTVTASSGPAIQAARKAYDALTPAQQKMVGNLKTLEAAEKAYANLAATPEDREKAQAVMNLIKALGKITLNSEKEVQAAREAFDALTDIQKLLVENLDTLETAEAELSMLKTLGKVSEPYISTGEYMEKLGTPSVGAIGGEWMVIGLARSGRTVPGVEDYYQKAVEYVQQSIDPDTGRLHKAKSTDNSRMILALTAIGKDVTNVGGYNLLAGLSDLEFVKYQGNNGPIWALLALDSGNYPVPSGGTTTRQALIDEILSVQTSDGGWAITGDKADSDMTGMALTALAPYYKKDPTVKQAIDKAIARLSEMQDDDGGFSTTYGDGKYIATSESTAQVLTALSALGIDGDTDSRFVKNGSSVVDALLRYYVKGGGFKHIMDGEIDGMGTEQAYYALTAYYRFLSGKTNLYDMTDIIDMGGDVVTVEPTVPAATEPAQAAQTNIPWWIIAVCIFGGVGWGVVIGIVLVPKLNKKKD